MRERTGKVSRETGETKATVGLDIDGRGNYNIDTGNGMLDHLLAQLSRHGLIDLNVSAQGDTQTGWHHVVEDAAIVLGRALREAVGDGRGITRMAHAYAPMDEALALSVVDFSGRGYAVIDTALTGGDELAGLSADLVRHFLDTLAREGGFNLHVRVLAGTSNHHRAEAIFKSMARAMKAALTVDERLGGDTPSTKGAIG